MIPTSANQLPIVGVMGSGSNAHPQRARQLGQWLATQQVHLLTGGGAGVMASVSRAFYEVKKRTGLVIGILPADTRDNSLSKKGYPNPWVEVPIHTHLWLSGTRGEDPMSRNHINVLSAQVVVALPGGWGTRAEILLAQQYRRPVIAWLRHRDELPDLPASVRTGTRFSAVQEFVREHIGKHGQGDG